MFLFIFWAFLTLADLGPIQLRNEDIKFLKIWYFYMKYMIHSIKLIYSFKKMKFNFLNSMSQYTKKSSF